MQALAVSCRHEMLQLHGQILRRILRRVSGRPPVPDHGIFDLVILIPDHTGSALIGFRHLSQLLRRAAPVGEQLFRNAGRQAVPDLLHMFLHLRPKAFPVFRGQGKEQDHLFFSQIGVQGSRQELPDDLDQGKDAGIHQLRVLFLHPVPEQVELEDDDAEDPVFPFKFHIVRDPLHVLLRRVAAVEQTVDEGVPQIGHLAFYGFRKPGVGLQQIAEGGLQAGKGRLMPVKMLGRPGNAVQDVIDRGRAQRGHMIAQPHAHRASGQKEPAQDQQAGDHPAVEHALRQKHIIHQIGPGGNVTDHLIGFPVKPDPALFPIPVFPQKLRQLPGLFFIPVLFCLILAQVQGFPCQIPDQLHTASPCDRHDFPDGLLLHIDPDPAVVRFPGGKQRPFIIEEFLLRYRIGTLIGIGTHRREPIGGHILLHMGIPCLIVRKAFVLQI